MRLAKQIVKFFSVEITPTPTSGTAVLAQQTISRIDELDNLTGNLAESAAPLQQMIKEHWHNAPEMLHYELMSAYSELLCLNNCNPANNKAN